MTIRVALFCSFHRGLSMLQTILDIQEKFDEVTLCGIATDDPSKPWTSANKRIWQYAHDKHEEYMVENLAKKHGIPVWKNRVNSDAFLSAYIKDWMPDVCYMGVFGQKIPEKIWSYPLYGFYNFHTCEGIHWPSNVGGNPVLGMINSGVSSGAVAMHAIDNFWDNGEFVAFSEFFPIYRQDDVVSVHKRSNPHAANMMAWHLGLITGRQYCNYVPRVSVAINDRLRNAAEIHI